MRIFFMFNHCSYSGLRGFINSDISLFFPSQSGPLRLNVDTLFCHCLSNKAYFLFCALCLSSKPNIVNLLLSNPDGDTTSSVFVVWLVRRPSTFYAMTQWICLIRLKYKNVANILKRTLDDNTVPNISYNALFILQKNRNYIKSLY